MLGIIIDKDTTLSAEAISKLAGRFEGGGILIALDTEAELKIKSMSRMASLPFCVISGLSEFKAISARLCGCISESVKGALFSLICYTPCYLSVSTPDARAAFTRLYLMLGKKAILPYLPSNIEKIKPEFCKSELEKILCSEIIRLPEAHRAYLYRY